MGLFEGDTEMPMPPLLINGEQFPAWVRVLLAACLLAYATCMFCAFMSYYRKL